MTKLFYDVFISHAYEDQNEFAGQLALALKKQGLKVWYSGFDLKLGTSISSSVNEALRDSKYGLVIISPVYLTKRWAMKELEALFAQETDVTRILPVLHKITVNELRVQLPIIADRYAVSSRSGMKNVVDRVLQVVKGKKAPVKKRAPGTQQKKSRRKKKDNESMNIRNAGVIVLGGSKVGNAAGGDINIRNSKK